VEVLGEIFSNKGTRLASTNTMESSAWFTIKEICSKESLIFNVWQMAPVPGIA
jgi:hypothetical protein